MKHRQYPSVYSIGIGSLRLPLFCSFLLLPLLFFLPNLLWAFNSSHVLGDAAEDLMVDYFQDGGWKSSSEQMGRQGIDGLSFKTENGVIKEVFIVESKYGRASWVTIWSAASGDISIKVRQKF